MFIVAVWYFGLPFLILAAAVGSFFVLRRRGPAARALTAVILVGLAGAWWFTAGFKLWEEHRQERDRRTFTLVLPAGYGGVFAVAVRRVAGLDEPALRVPIGDSGVGFLDLPENFSEVGHRFRAETHDAEKSHAFTGFASQNNVYYFCVDENLIDCPVPPLDDGAAFGEAVERGRKLSDLLK